MLTIHVELIKAVLEKALNDYPIETCGLISGPEGSNLPLRFIPMQNIANSEIFYEFDPKQHFKIWQELDELKEEPIVIFHSHTHSKAYPSRSDIELAVEPNAHYLIVSVDDSHREETRSFRIIDGIVTEERVNIVNDYKRNHRPIIAKEEIFV